MALRPVAALAVAVLLAGCGRGVPAGDGVTPSPSLSPTGRDPAQRYEISTTVLQDAKHGPQLCAGGVLDSLPPQCGGPDVVPFSWNDVANEESRGGTTWAVVHLVGTFDGTTFRPTEPPGAPVPASPRPAVTFPTPCPEPDGGWFVVDPATNDRDAAVAYADRQPDVAGVWISRPVAGIEVLNLAFTGDVPRHEREARAVYGGRLCVSSLPRSRTDLLRVQHEVDTDTSDAIQLLGSGRDDARNVVDVTVYVADATATAYVASRWGDAVTLTGVLHPVG